MGRGWNIWALTVATGVARPLVAGDYDDIEPQFSPDRRRLAFTSNRSGRWAVYVQDLQAPGTEPRMVSAGLGESDPRWSPSGDTLYYLSGDRRLLAVPARRAGRPADPRRSQGAVQLGGGRPDRHRPALQLRHPP